MRLRGAWNGAASATAALKLTGALGDFALKLDLSFMTAPNSSGADPNATSPEQFLVFSIGQRSVRWYAAFELTAPVLFSFPEGAYDQYSARSGYGTNSNKTALPLGPWVATNMFTYGITTAGPIDRSANSQMYHPSMVDTFGWGWSIRLLPVFSTTREAIAVHPDGGPPGTLGCIGIALSAAGAFGNRLIDYFMTRDFIRVWVIP